MKKKITKSQTVSNAIDTLGRHIRSPEFSPPSEYRILVCGSRDWTDIDTINKHLCKLIVERGYKYKDVLVITGGASGADELVATLCHNELGIACAVFTAPWQFFAQQDNRRAAGPVRNGWMLRWGRPDAVLAFHPYLPKSKGTKHMVDLARKAGVHTVRVIDKEVKVK